MAKVEIITRAFNRLEYTVMCVRSIDKMAGGYKDYSHTVINQNSTDGTKQWLDSLLMENYYKLKVKHNVQNSGDAGGMKQGFDVIDPDCNYIMQFDNDCEVITYDFLNILVGVMDHYPDVGTIMLKREGVTNVLKTYNDTVINGRNYGELNDGTCCMIMRRNLIEEINLWFDGENIGWGHKVTTIMKQKKYRILKSLDVRVNHIDSSAGQVKKYPRYFSGKKDNVVRSNYTRVTY